MWFWCFLFKDTFYLKEVVVTTSSVCLPARESGYKRCKPSSIRCAIISHLWILAVIILASQPEIKDCNLGRLRKDSEGWTSPTINNCTSQTQTNTYKGKEQEKPMWHWRPCNYGLIHDGQLSVIYKPHTSCKASNPVWTNPPSQCKQWQPCDNKPTANTTSHSTA